MLRLCSIALIVVMAAFSLSCSAQPDSRFNPVLTDDFNDPASGWDSHTLENGDSAAYEKGEYISSINGANRVIWFRNSSPSYIQGDFACEVDATNVSGAADDSECGIIFRGQNYDSYYLFKVKSSEKSYCLAKFLKGKWTVLKDWTVSDNIKGGANTNRLGVSCIADSIEVSANGGKLASVIDNSLASGYIALELGTWTSPSARYKFDNFKLFTARPPASASVTAGPSTAPATPVSPTPSAPPVIQATAGASAVSVDSTLLKDKLVKLVFADDFSNPKSGWAVSTTKNAGTEYKGGEYSIWNKNPDAGYSSSNSSYQMPQDFVFEVKAKQIEGDGSSGLGITFRANENNDRYGWLVLGDGQQALFKIFQGKKSYLNDISTIVQGSGDKSPIMITIVCVGSQIEIYANNMKLAAVTDTSPLKGGKNISLIVTTGNPVVTRYNFDDLKLYSVQ